MQNKTLLIVFSAGLLFTSTIIPAFSGPVATSDSLTSLANEAVSSDPALSGRAIARLREQGPVGFDALLAAHAEILRQHKLPAAPGKPANDEASWVRLCNALDKVSAQHDSYASRLFWYTDFQQAKTAAAASGKPILSLRLLGRLDEDCSCANSRFFRTTLYVNAEVSRYLREHFILHWKSVRPVPRITIDFGDGRRIERTVTGNSIHYILDSAGDSIDALPGLYGPKTFLRQLQIAEKEAVRYGADKNANRIVQLRQYHAALQAASRADFENDLARVSGEPGFQPVKARLGAPTALAATRLASSKSGVERPILNSFQETDDATWKKIAMLHYQDAVMDGSAVRLIQNKTPSAKDAGALTISKVYVETPLLRMIHKLQSSIAEDTVRNEYQFHSTIHQWFAEGSVPKDLDALNARVYAELFLTPDSDPWLGLVPADTFTGLDHNGLVCPTK